MASEKGVAMGSARPAGRRLGDRGSVSSAERVYFAAVGLLAALVGLPYLAPAKVDKVLPFGVPPLHARVIAAIYISGLALTIGGMLGRRWSDISIVPAIVAVWTGGLLLVTLLHSDDFDFTKLQTRVWLGAYVAYPLIAIWLLVWHRRGGAVDEPGRAPSDWARWCLTGQGVVLTAVALALFFAPGSVAGRWPWPVTSLLAQIYSMPLLAFGIGSLLLARARSWREMRVGVVGIGLFGPTALVASVIHSELFSADDPAAWAWFAILIFMTALATMLVVSENEAP